MTFRELEVGQEFRLPDLKNPIVYRKSSETEAYATTDSGQFPLIFWGDTGINPSMEVQAYSDFAKSSNQGKVMTFGELEIGSCFTIDQDAHMDRQGKLIEYAKRSSLCAALIGTNFKFEVAQDVEVMMTRKPTPEFAAVRWQDRLDVQKVNRNFGNQSPYAFIKGTDILSYDIVGMITNGWTWAVIMKEHPEVTEDDIRACLAYAIEMDEKIQESTDELEESEPDGLIEAVCNKESRYKEDKQGLLAMFTTAELLAELTKREREGKL